MNLKETTQKSQNPEPKAGSGISARFWEEAQELVTKTANLVKDEGAQKFLLNTAIIGASVAIAESFHVNCKSLLKSIDTDGNLATKWLPKPLSEGLDLPGQSVLMAKTEFASGKVIELSRVKTPEGQSSLSKLNSPLIADMPSSHVNFDAIHGKESIQLDTASSIINRKLSTGFSLPPDVSFSDVYKKPPVVMETHTLPGINDPEYDSKVAARFGIDLDLRPDNSIGILHPRFRNGEKQLNLAYSDKHVVSLYGNAESGVGVLEYVPMPSVRKYFSSADSVVQIKIDGENAGVGSGTIISKDGVIATAAHVIDGGGDIYVFTKHGRFAADIIAKQYSGTHDIAALRLRDVPEGLSFPVPGLTSAYLSRGSKAATIGHPQGLSQQFAAVGSYWGDVDYSLDSLHGDYPTFLLDSSVPGNSGGPIFDHNGNLSAVLSKLFTPNAGTYMSHLERGLALGNRIEDLLKLLKENDIAPFNS